jgi:hypothetical protein
VEGLREGQGIASEVQLDVAVPPNIKQPSVSKIEKQTDMYLSTLRNYIEAIGGELELVVKLPKRLRSGSISSAAPCHIQCRDDRRRDAKGAVCVPRCFRR